MGYWLDRLHVVCRFSCESGEGRRSPAPRFASGADVGRRVSGLGCVALLALLLWPCGLAIYDFVGLAIVALLA